MNTKKFLQRKLCNTRVIKPGVAAAASLHQNMKTEAEMC